MSDTPPDPTPDPTPEPEAEREVTYHLNRKELMTKLDVVAQRAKSGEFGYGAQLVENLNRLGFTYDEVAERMSQE